MDTLPDELVREILAYILTVSDDDFDSPCSSPMFGRLVMPSSVVLLVSKRWLRIATPLLYECVVLRNTPQTEAFFRTLKGESGRELKRFVRRMRIEATFGTVTKKMLSAVPSITVLFCKLPTHYNEKVNGMIHGLPRLTPRRVIFDFSCHGSWKNVSLVTNTMASQVQRWTSLVEFKLHISTAKFTAGSWDSGRKLLLCLCQALNSASSLRSLTLSFFDNVRSVVDAPKIIRTIGNNPSLCAVHVFVYDKRSFDEILSSLRDHPRASIIHCSLIPRSGTQQLPTRCPDVTGHAPQLLRKVLRRVVDMHLESFYNDGYRSSSASLEPLARLTRRCKNRCATSMAVSKKSYMIVLPFTFRFLTIDSLNWLLYVAQKLTDDTNFNSSVEGFLLCDRTDAKNTFTEDKVRAVVDKVVKCLPNLRLILVTSDTAFALDSVPHEARMTIEHLYFEVTSSRINQAALYRFANLTHLTLVGVDGVDLNVEILDKRVRPCFQNVISVTIEEVCDLSVIRALQSCDFPAAQSLRIRFPILDYRGDCDLSSELLPRFPTLRFFFSQGAVYGPYSQLLRVDGCGIEVIKIARQRLNSFERLEIASVHEYMTHVFMGIELSNLKALREVQLIDVGDWPWEDHLLKDARFQDFVQSLIDTYGFKITNRYGVPWRPRLLLLPKNKTTKAKKSEVSDENRR